MSSSSRPWKRALTWAEVGWVFEYMKITWKEPVIHLGSRGLWLDEILLLGITGKELVRQKW
jgi:hypothetical protein